MEPCERLSIGKRMRRMQKRRNEQVEKCCKMMQRKEDLVIDLRRVQMIMATKRENKKFVKESSSSSLLVSKFQTTNNRRQNILLIGVVILTLTFLHTTFGAQKETAVAAEIITNSNGLSTSTSNLFGDEHSQLINAATNYIFSSNAQTKHHSTNSELEKTKSNNWLNEQKEQNNNKITDDNTFYPSSFINNNNTKQVLLRDINEQSATTIDLNKRRVKRHLAAAAASRPLEQEQEAGDSVVARELDCQTLAKWWSFTRTNFPALAAQLMRWSSGEENFLQRNEPTTKLSLPTRLVSSLLDEVERAARKQYNHNSNNNNNLHHHQQQQPQLQQQRQMSTWLSRISASPTYSRLVQQLRHKQQQQHAQHRQHDISDSPSIEPIHYNSKFQDVSRTPATKTTTTTTSNQQHSYGRLIHYPHEITNVDNSNGMARTLNKLRFLSNQNKQQADNFVESNKIPQLPADVEQLSDGEWHKLAGNSGGGSENSRTEFVYGKVLLAPSDLGREQQQANKYSNSLAKLREIALVQGQQGGGSTLQHENDDNNDEEVDRNKNNEKSVENPKDHQQAYGRIVTSAPNSSGGQLLNNHNAYKNLPVSDQHMSSATKIDEQDHRNDDRINDNTSTRAPSSDETVPSSPSEDSAHNHQLQAGYNLFVDGGTGYSSSSNELVNQHRSQQVAVSDEEFEGDFSAPFAHPILRQLRSDEDKHNQQQQQQLMKKRTATASGSSSSQHHRNKLESVTPTDGAFILD